MHGNLLDSASRSLTVALKMTNDSCCHFDPSFLYFSRSLHPSLQVSVFIICIWGFSFYQIPVNMMGLVRASSVVQLYRLALVFWMPSSQLTSVRPNIRFCRHLEMVNLGSESDYKPILFSPWSSLSKRKYSSSLTDENCDFFIWGAFYGQRS